MNTFTLQIINISTKQFSRLIAFVVLSICLSANANEALFNKGMEAYQNQDYQSAIKIWKTAAKRKSVSAMYSLGVMYDQGSHVARDVDEAEQWYLKAAKIGAPQAQHNLGKLYAAKNQFSEAAEWFDKAARSDFAHSQYELAMLYEKGKGVPQDNAKAEELYIKAGENGSAPAQYKLVLMYMKGDGVEQNDEKAFSWAKAASESGDANAKYLLGYMYYSGTGTVQNDLIAKIWLEDALNSGQDEAQKILDLIEKRADKKLSSL